MSFQSGGSFPASLAPAQKKLTLQSNYLSFNGESTGSGQDMNNFAQQYLPELYEAEVERYGNRTLSGFLRMVGAEMPMTSDQVIWSEQNRLHVGYSDASASVAGSFDIRVDLNLAAAYPGGNSSSGAVRQGQTIMLADRATGLITAKALVQSVGDSGASGKTNDRLECTLYETAASGFPGALTGSNKANLFVYGSEFGKDLLEWLVQFNHNSHSFLIHQLS
jgi:hypothetical protein